MDMDPTEIERHSLSQSLCRHSLIHLVFSPIVCYIYYPSPAPQCLLCLFEPIPTFRTEKEGFIVIFCISSTEPQAI
ncbi:putative aldehyde dehydrogenase-like protein [Fusarium oxysporum f. sp. albedinis]|nr:putative aldehyde dehydrogenase-like protein [Fusarium oxysporum f. sp. albedinis]